MESELLLLLSDETRFRILENLVKRGEASVVELSERVGRHRSTVSRHLARLEEAGLITRRVVQGGAYIYYPTEKGVETYSALVERGFMPDVFLKVSRARKVFKAMAMVPVFLLAATAFWGLFFPGKVSAVSRILWFGIFMGLAAALYRLVSKVFG